MKFNLRGIAMFALLLGMVAVTHTPAATVTLQPDGAVGKDTFVDSRPGYGGNNNMNWDGQNRIAVGHNDTSNGNHVHGLIQFDLSAAPLNDIVRVELHLNRFTGAGSQTTTSVHRTLNPWNESTVTWNTKPGHDGNAIDTITIDGFGWYAWDVTTQYLDWMHGVHANHGFYLKTGNNNGENFSFASSDHADPTMRPMLVIETADPQPAIPAPLAVVVGVGLMGWSFTQNRKRKV